MIDQQKAFDRIDHDYLYGILKAFNLPEDFITWVKILYNDIESKIEVNGTSTKPFKVTRSLRQGCLLSMLLFIIAAEGMAELIRNNQDIKGYYITGKTQKKLVAYADDTTLILTSQESITTSLNTIEKYCSASGAKINNNELECIRLGTWKSMTIREALSWVKNDVKILGLIYSHTNMSEKNYQHIIDKAQIKMERWSKRTYSLEGRAHLANIYILPQIIYRMKHLIIPPKLWKTLQTKIYNFIWNKKIEKVSRKNITKPKNIGGIGLIDLKIRQQATWHQIGQHLMHEPNLDHNLLTRIT